MTMGDLRRRASVYRVPFVLQSCWTSDDTCSGSQAFDKMA
jgi:hypothetical protein